MKNLIAGFAAMAFTLVATVALAQTPAPPANDPIKRTPLQKTEYPEGHFTYVMMVEIAPNATIGRHSSGHREQLRPRRQSRSRDRRQAAAGVQGRRQFHGAAQRRARRQSRRQGAQAHWRLCGRQDQTARHASTGESVGGKSVARGRMQVRASHRLRAAAPGSSRISPSSDGPLLYSGRGAMAATNLKPVATTAA